MRYRHLGHTGLEVSSQCLGAMMFGAVGNRDHDECVRMVHAALEAGINFVDTADVYSQGESEEIVGRALKGRRDEVVLATKFYNPMGKDRNHRGGSRRWIMQAVEGSLRRLDTDYIDLYQMHRHDWNTDLEESLGALSDLVHQGKVRYLGSSSFPAEWIVEAQWAANRRRSERFVCEQPQYSLLARGAESAVFPTCQRYGMGVICWSPLASGWLTGKYRRGEAAPEGSRLASRAMTRGRSPLEHPSAAARYDAVEALEDIAADAGVPLTHMALAFVGTHPAVTSTIIGPKTSEQLDILITSADLTLSSDVLDAIDAVLRPGADAPGTTHFVPNPGLETDSRRRNFSPNT